MVLKDQGDREIKTLKTHFKTSQPPSPSPHCDKARTSLDGSFGLAQVGVLTFSP